MKKFNYKLFLMLLASIFPVWCFKMKDEWKDVFLKETTKSFRFILFFSFFCIQNFFAIQWLLVMRSLQLIQRLVHNLLSEKKISSFNKNFKIKRRLWNDEKWNFERKKKFRFYAYDPLHPVLFLINLINELKIHWKWLTKKQVLRTRVII